MSWNPYWDAVRDHVRRSPHPWRGGLVVGGLDGYRLPDGGVDVERWGRECPQRGELVGRYAWTVTSPDTVGFVVSRCGGRVVDPLAGTGYWAELLARAGVDVVASDLEPGTNAWHRGYPTHRDVVRGDAREVVAGCSDRTLLLSWPPYGSPVGVETVRTFPGGVVVYVGEGCGGCCGDDALFEEFGAGWAEVACHVPVRWDGLRDVVTVFERR